MRLSVVAATLIFATGTPALAQSTEALREALGHMPEFILTNPAPDQAYFLDTTALRHLVELAGAELDTPSLRRLRYGATQRPVDALIRGSLADWEKRSGIAFDQVRYFAGIDTAPRSITYWGLADDDAAAGLLDALQAQDFQPRGSEGIPGDILGNGAPMEMDREKQDPSDPWRGTFGASSFVAAKANAVIQSPFPDAFQVLLAEQPGAAGNPVVTTALAGLDQAVGDGWIVQAMLVSPSFGLTAFDPAQDLLLPQAGNLDDIRDRLAEGMTAGLEGIPPYFGGFIADVQLDRPAVVLSVSYEDCDTAEPAANQIGQRWTETMPQTAQGEITATTAPGPDGLCAAVVTIVGENQDPIDNPLHIALDEAFMNRQFSVLQIGTE